MVTKRTINFLIMVAGALLVVFYMLWWVSGFEHIYLGLGGISAAIVMLAVSFLK